MEYYLKLDHIGLQYHKKYPLITDFSLSLNKGEIGCLLGASGCGKTTILNAIAGFHPVNHGSIFINQQCVSSTDFSLPVEQRHVGMVFQQHNLFPHLNVTRNILFGLRHTNRQEQHNRLEFLLALIRLSDLKDKYPHQLSGGQQQRVALARALAPRPDILLLDEPFASQDTELRENLAGEIRDILKYEHTTALLVTHNQLEAFSMADRIGIIHEGTLQQWDSGYQIYHEPANRFVANFIGQASFIRGEVIAHDQVKTCLGLLQGSLPQDIRTGQKVDVLMRPDDLEHDDLSPLKAHIINKRFRGVNFLYTLSLDNGEILHCYVPSHHNHAIGEKLGITITLDHLIVFT